MQLALAELQKAFSQHLRDEPSALAAAIVTGGKIDVDRRMEIYHHAYRARLTEVMQDVFERAWAYLGDANFEQGAHGYIATHPPAGRTLQHFGGQFPAWLAAQYPGDGDLADVAMIDWQLRCAFDSADATPISMADMAAIDAAAWATVGFQFHPALSLTPIIFNAASIWQALNADTPPPPAEKLGAPTWLMVWRREFQPHFVTVSEAEAMLLASMREGKSFAMACDEVASRFADEDVVALAGAALRRWVEEGVIVSITGIAA